MDEDIKIKFINIFYYEENENENFIPLFKENAKNEILKLYQEIFNSNNPELILKLFNFLYEIMLKCYDIAIILLKSESLIIEKNISIIELLIESYMKFPNNENLKNKIIEILKYFIDNFSIDLKHYFYLFKNITNNNKNPSKETFNNYIDILKIFYPNEKAKETNIINNEKYFFFYNIFESGLKIDKKIEIKNGFAFKFWFYIEKYHKNENSNLIKIKISNNIYQLNLTNNKINILLNEKIKEGLSYEIKEKEWNCIIFGITKTTWNNLIIFSYKLENNINETIIKSNPINNINLSLDSIILFENFIGRVSSILFYNVNKNSVMDFFNDNEFKQVNKKNLNISINKQFSALFSPQTIDYERMEIIDPINHYKAFYLKKNNFLLNYYHKLKKKKNNSNNFEIKMFYPILDLIYEKYNNEEGVLLFNKLFGIISEKIEENLELKNDDFFKIFSCYLYNFNKCFLEENILLNDFLYKLFATITTNETKFKVPNDFLTNLMFNCKIMSKFSEKQQIIFWDFILGKIMTFQFQNNGNSSAINKNKSNEHNFKIYFSLDYLKTFFVHEFEKDFEMNEDRNIIKVIKFIFNNEGNNIDKANKDKLFFFKFLLNEKISFQKVEFMVNLFYDYFQRKEKWPKGREESIIKYFIEKDFIIYLFLIFTIYPISIKEITIRILRFLYLNYYDRFNKTMNSEKKKKLVKILDKYFLFEYNLYTKKEEEETNLKNSETNNFNQKNNILKMNLEDNKLFLIVDIFHLTLRLIIQNWANDNLEFKYELKYSIDDENLKKAIIESFVDISRLIIERNYNNKDHLLFLSNNFMKCFFKIYYDNYFLIKKNENDLKDITELIQSKGLEILRILTTELLTKSKCFPINYISFIMNLNFKIYKNTNDFNEKFSFFNHFYSELIKNENINTFEEEIKIFYKKLLDDSSIDVNCFKEDTIFNFSYNQILKISDWLKTKNDYTYKNAKLLKNGIESFNNIFYLTIYLIFEGYIKRSIVKLNEYCSLLFILICCDIQHRFDKNFTENDSYLYNVFEGFFNFFFTNFFIFYFSDYDNQVHYVKIINNIIKISKIIFDKKKPIFFASNIINLKSKFIISLKTFQIINLDDSNKNDYNNYTFSTDDLNKIDNSDDDLNLYIKKKLDEKKEMYLRIISDLYEKDGEINDNQNYDIKNEVKTFFKYCQNEFQKEYWNEKNTTDFINEYQNYKCYRKLKKNLCSFNSPYSNFNIFYTKEGKKKLKYKVSSHLTKEYSRPLIIPILDFNHYLPHQFKEEFLKDDIKDIYSINTYLLKSNTQLYYYSEQIIRCCLIKVTHHINGFMLIDQNKIEFFGNKFKEKYNHYDIINKKCFGSFIDDYKEKHNFYLKINFSDIIESINRKYYYIFKGIEIYTKSNKSYFFLFLNDKDIDYINTKITSKNLNIYEIKEKWYNNEISTFNFLMILNIYGNRSYKDITQYPIFPWVYPSNDTKITNALNKIFINLKNQRDLNKPIGLIDINERSKSRCESYDENYNSMVQDLKNENPNIEFNYQNYSYLSHDNKFDWDKIPYYYGSFYSNQVYVSHYLNRIFPFTFTSLEIQSWQFDLPERLFSNLQYTFTNSISEKSDVRELIPEFFFLPEIFKNINNLNFGFANFDEDNINIEIDDVILPEFVKKKNELMIIIFKYLLEKSNKDEIFEWVNLIFGEYQFGNMALKKKNIFLPYAYSEWAFKKINSVIKNQNELNDVLKLYEFGVVPKNLFKSDDKKKKYKKRNSEIKIPILNLENLAFSCKSNSIKIEKYHFIYLYKNIAHLIKDDSIVKLNYNNNSIFQDDKIKFQNIISSYKKFLYFENEIFIIITGFYDGSAYVIYKNKNESEEIRIKNKKISIYDKSLITAMEINKNENIIYLGTNKGRIIIYYLRNFKFEYYKMLRNNTKRINYINSNDILNMFITCSEDGFINLFTFPKCDLVNSIYDINKCEYVFLFNFPIPSFSTFSNSNSKFMCYTLNGNEIYLNDLEVNVNTHIQNEIIYNPITITNKFNDYLIYISNGINIIIRKAPYLNIIFQQKLPSNNTLLFSSIKEINNCIHCIIVQKDKYLYLVSNNYI